MISLLPRKPGLNPNIQILTMSFQDTLAPIDWIDPMIQVMEGWLPGSLIVLFQKEEMIWKLQITKPCGSRWQIRKLKS